MEIKNLFSNRNIIITITIFFVLWVLFFDRNNYWDVRTLDDKIKTLKTEHNYYKTQIKADSAIIEGLKDSIYLEQYARENFFMKRPGETMFLIDDKELLP